MSDEEEVAGTGTNITKADLAVEIAESLKTFSRKEATQVVNGLLEIMASTLASGEELKISGFGNFLIQKKTARRGRNPRTGAEVPIPARAVLKFKPSQLLRENINTLDAVASSHGAED